MHNRTCVTNVWARGLLVFIAVWRLQFF